MILVKKKKKKKIGFCLFTLLVNSYFWFKYNKKATKIQKKSEGWSGFYLVSTFLILMVLFDRL